MAATVYRCKQSFTTSVDGRRRSYSAGDLVLDDDPVNPARHPNFEEVSEYVRRTRPGVKREEPKPEPVVEQATAEPGEKRSVGRPPGRPRKNAVRRPVASDE